MFIATKVALAPPLRPLPVRDCKSTKKKGEGKEKEHFFNAGS